MKQNTVRKDANLENICNCNIPIANINYDIARGIEIGKYSEQDEQFLARILSTEVTELSGSMPTLLAMAHVFLNRVKSGIANSICAACTDIDLIEHFYSYKKLRKGEFSSSKLGYNKSLKVARAVLSGQSIDLTEGCNFFHPRAFKVQRCIFCEPRLTIGGYFFYHLDYQTFKDAPKEIEFQPSRYFYSYTQQCDEEVTPSNEIDDEDFKRHELYAEYCAKCTRLEME